MTDDELDAIATRAMAATPGPWQWRDVPVTKSLALRRLCDRAGGELLTATCHDTHTGCMGAGIDAYHVPDEMFIASARDDVPALVAEVRRLRKIFDDAGQGEHNILALIEHYQAGAMNADERVREARAGVHYEASVLIHDMWRKAGNWHGPHASSHYRSHIADRIEALTGRRPSPDEPLAPTTDDAIHHYATPGKPLCGRCRTSYVDGGLCPESGYSLACWLDEDTDPVRIGRILRAARKHVREGECTDMCEGFCVTLDSCSCGYHDLRCAMGEAT